MYRRHLPYLAGLLLLLIACSTQQNTVVSRGYHNLTARYNGLYYSTVNLDDGVFRIEKNNKENYENVIPIYVYPSQEQVKGNVAEFDKAVKKSSLSIQKHAIKDKKGSEIAAAGKWIDNNWLNIGMAHFYKREFFSAIETFEYVARMYNKSDDKFTALLWLIKTNNEIGAVSTSENYLSFLKNERNLPRKIAREFPVAYADYYIRRGQYTEAIAKLMEATRNKGIFKGLSKTRRARYSFIIAQLSERQGDLKRAREYYDRTVRLKPAYEMIFYSKIKIARLFDIKNNNTVKLKKDLLKMSREFKNTDYNDVIFFTLGEIEEKEKNIPQALSYYNQAVRKSVNNPNQKALSFLKMAEINFDLTNYQPAEAYYDSTIAALSPDHPDYNNIIARKKTLETLVKQIKTISREDSLQRIAKMSETDRNKFIDRLIEQLEKEEARRLRDLENAQNNAASSTNTLGSSGGASQLPGMGSSATFYFYSPTLVSFGIVDYVKKWGNRKQEDNWRRSGKALLMDEQTADGGRRDSAGVTKVDSIKKMKLGRDFYLKDLPMNDTLLTKSTNRIIKAYYVMGSVYKEELNNTKKTISTFEELNTRYPDNRYALNTYYSLYRIYLQEKNTSKAEYYKNKILTEFPESEFAMLIKNPDYAQERNAQKSEVEDFYSQVLADYRSANFQEALSKSKKGISAYGKSDYLSKFEFIKAVSAGKLKGVDTLEKELKLLVAKYPDSEVTPLSQDILNSIKKQKNPILQQARELARTKADSFHVNAALPHFIIAFLPDDTKLVDAFKTNVANFNTIYYNSQTFDISSTLFEKQQFVLIKSFADAKEVISYHESLCADADTYKGLKKENVEIFPISSENLPILYKSKNLEGYRAFYIAQYQGKAKKN